MSRSGASLFVGCILITACLGSGACSSDESASKVGRRSDAVEDGLGPWLDTPNFDSFNLHAIIDGSVAGQPNLHDNMWGDCHVGGGSCTLPSGVNNWSEIFRNPTIAESDTLKKAIRTIVGRIVSGDFTSAYVLNDPSVTALSTINYEADTHYDSFMDRMIIVVRQKPKSTGDDYKDNSDPVRTNRGRNWGTFIFNEKPTNWTVIQAPHPRFDDGTELMAVDAFEKGDCFALMVAGTNRYAIDHSTTESTYGGADVAHAPTVYGSTGGAGEGNAFNLVQRAILDEGSASVVLNILQLHGYDEAVHGYPADAVISSSVFATAGDSSSAQIRTFASSRIRAAVEAAYPRDESPLVVPTPAKEFKAQAGNFIFEGSRNLQAFDASGSNASYAPPVRVLFTHVEMPQCIRLNGYSGTNCSYRSDDDRLQMARTLAYAADDAMAEVEYALLPSKDAVGVTRCTGTVQPQLGWDSDLPPANADGSPETGTDGLARMFTLQGISHNSPFTFVGFHLDSPRLTGVPKCDSTTAGRWAGNQRRVALKRLGLRAVPCGSAPSRPAEPADPARARTQRWTLIPRRPV